MCSCLTFDLQLIRIHIWMIDSSTYMVRLHSCWHWWALLTVYSCESFMQSRFGAQNIRSGEMSKFSWPEKETENMIKGVQIGDFHSGLNFWGKRLTPAAKGVSLNTLNCFKLTTVKLKKVTFHRYLPRKFSTIWYKRIEEKLTKIISNSGGPSSNINMGMSNRASKDFFPQNSFPEVSGYEKCFRGSWFRLKLFWYFSQSWFLKPRTFLLAALN